MNNQEFEKVLETRIELIKSTLSRKAKEYSTDDRLYNFKRAAEIARTTTEKALFGMFLKHLVSVIDIVEGKRDFDGQILDEKIGDAINYLILLEAVLVEKSKIIDKII